MGEQYHFKINDQKDQGSLFVIQVLLLATCIRTSRTATWVSTALNSSGVSSFLSRDYFRKKERREKNLPSALPLLKCLQQSQEGPNSRTENSSHDSHKARIQTLGPSPLPCKNFLNRKNLKKRLQVRIGRQQLSSC